MERLVPIIAPAGRLAAETIGARGAVNGDAVFPAEAEGVGGVVREPSCALLLSDRTFEFCCMLWSEIVLFRPSVVRQKSRQSV